MTYEPPAPPPPPPPAGPPPGMPPTPPPPPPGGYGGATPSGGGFNPQSVNPLDWAILALGLLTFIFSFLSYYTATAKAFGFKVSVHENAWHGFFGWFAMICAVAASIVVAISLFAPTVSVPLGARIACLGLYAIATLCVILAWFITPGVSGAVSGVDFGRGFGFYGSLVFIIAGLVLSLMRAQQTGTALPGPLSKMPKIGR